MAKPRTTEKAAPNLTEVAANSGEDVGLRFVDELRTPRDEVLLSHGQGDLVLYERLMRDDQVFPCFKQRRESVLARETKVDPGGPTELDKRAADSLRQQLKRISWDRITYRMLAGLMYGYGVGECMFRVADRFVLEDGQVESSHVVLDTIKVRRAKRFRWGVDGRLRLLREGKHELLPERKFWTYTSGADDDDDPYGRGLGHWLYWPVWLKRNGIRFWAIFLERFSSPTPKLEVPAGTPEAKMKELMALLDRITNGGKIVIPRGVALELIQAVKDSGGDYQRFCDRMDAAIAKIILTQTMTTTPAQTGLGSTQGEVQERVGNTGAKTDSDLLTESFAMGPGAWLTEWNFPGAAPPLVYRDFASAEDLTARASRDASLMQAGYRPTPENIRDTYGDGYEPIAQPEPAPTQPINLAEAIAGALKPNVEGDAIDRLLAQDGWRDVLGPEVERIEDMLEGARSLEEVRDRLGELALDSPEKLVDGLARVMFAAKVHGRAGG